jgi:Flp pilus assembly pilin Flp
MSVTTIVAAAIVIVASVALVLVGNAYRWNLSSPGYGRWTRIMGAVAVVGLAGVAAWSRIETPLVAALVVLVGVALAAGYVLLHRRLTERLTAVSGDSDEA